MTVAETPLYQRREWLSQKYVSERLSCDAIAALCGLRSHVSILYWKKRFGIPSRTLSEARGDRAPMLGRHHSAEAKEKIGRAFRGIKRGPQSAEHKRHLSEAVRGRWTGQKNPNWNNGASYAVYPREFNNELRDKIRNRDNYSCQFPGCDRRENGHKFHVHHLDENPKNNQRGNLILLCLAHHRSVHNSEVYKKKLLNKGEV